MICYSIPLRSAVSLTYISAAKIYFHIVRQNKKIKAHILWKGLEIPEKVNQMWKTAYICTLFFDCRDFGKKKKGLEMRGEVGYNGCRW